MPSLYLVRHGKSAAGFAEASDPILAPDGHRQAKNLAVRFRDRFAPMPVLSSPWQRARQTAAPLAEIWGLPIQLEDCVAEIPCPVKGDDGHLAMRAPWLSEILTQRYGALDPAVESWRRTAISGLCALETDAVIFTHFLTINALVGQAQGDDRVVVFDPGYCNVTALTLADGKLSVRCLSLWPPAAPA